MSCFETSTFLKNPQVFKTEVFIEAVEKFNWEYKIKSDNEVIVTKIPNTKLHGEYAIKIKNGTIIVEASLNNSESSKKFFESLPLEGTANTWGEEIYFDVNLDLKEENGVEEVNIGDIAYWPPGKAFCIFFGKTPASTNEKPRAASKVNILGNIVGEATIFKNIKDGDKLVLEHEE